MRLILASTSPRRREILALLGAPFEVIAPDFVESLSPGRSLEDEVLDFSFGKAASVAAKNPQSIVVGGDTMILLEGKKVGKPADAEDAKRILRFLSGKTHRIYTAVAILDGLGGPGHTAVEEVSVRMRAYADAEVERYVAAGESLDKAGAYSIQGRGRALIEAIDGDYLAAVGLPLKPLAAYLKSRGVAIPLDVDRLYAEKAFLNWRTF